MFVQIIHIHSTLICPQSCRWLISPDCLPRSSTILRAPQKSACMFQAVVAILSILLLAACGDSDASERAALAPFKEGALLIDVRTAEEFAGAYSVLKPVWEVGH